MERFKNQKLSQILNWDMYAYCFAKHQRSYKEKLEKWKQLLASFTKNRFLEYWILIFWWNLGNLFRVKVKIHETAVIENRIPFDL